MRLWLNWIERQTTDLKVESSSLSRRVYKGLSSVFNSLGNVSSSLRGPVAQLVRVYA